MSARHGGDGETVGWLRGQLADMARRLRKAEGECARLRAELAEAEQHIRAQNEVDRILAMGIRPAANGDTGPIARVPGPRAAAHRAPKAPRERPPWLKVVPAFAPLAVLARLAVKGSAARKVTGVALAALVGIPAVTVGTQVMRDAPDYAAAVPAPAAVTAPATPAPPAAATRPRRRHRKPALVSVPPPATVTRPSRSPSPSSLPPQGTLDVAQVSVTLQPGVILGVLSGQVDLTAIGGPVTWSADAPGLSLDSGGGTIPSGQTVVVTVSVPAGQLGGSATITLWPGGIPVAVSWLPGLPAGLPSSAAMSG